MSRIVQAQLANALLRAISPEDFGRLAPELRRVDTPVRKLVFEVDQPVETVLFPESGIISLMTAGDTPTEIAIVGAEGAVGVQVVLGIDRTPLRAFTQIAGEGYEIAAAALLEATEASPTLRMFLSRYVYILLLQASGTAGANGNYTVEQRLARWLVMCQDRVGDTVTLTHEFLATMLGCRRPGVTVATHILEGHGFIRAKRGQITIRSREGLLEFADGSYGLAESEYQRVFGAPIAPPPSAI